MRPPPNIEELVERVVYWAGEDMRRHRGGRGSILVSGRELDKAIARLYKAATGEKPTGVQLWRMGGLGEEPSTSLGACQPDTPSPSPPPTDERR